MEYLKIELISNYKDENDKDDYNQAIITDLIRDYNHIISTLEIVNHDVIMQIRKVDYYNNIKGLLDYVGIAYYKTIEMEQPYNVEPIKNIVAICDDCGDYIYQSDDIYTTNDERTICGYCFDSDYCHCFDCDDVIPIDDAIHTHDGNDICERCYSDYYFTCSDCGDVFNWNDRYEYHGDYYCENCYNYIDDDDDCDAIGLLQGYHDHSREFNHILKTSDSDNLNETIGFELETEQSGSGTSRKEFCYTIDNNFNANETLVHFETDGSLDYGVEIISEPMTLEYWNAHKDNTFKDLVNKCREMGYHSHDGGNCGLHVHFNKELFGSEPTEQQQKLNTLYLFFETYKDEITKLSRRKRFDYCHFLSDCSYSTFENFTSEQLQKYKKPITQSLNYINAHKVNTGHNAAINANASTHKTFEIRIMRGTLKYQSFIACIEFIVNLIKCIQNEPLEKISFTKVVNYLPTLYLKDYINESDIKANYKRLKDNAKQLATMQKQLEAKIEKMTTSINKELFGLLNKRAKIIKGIERKTFDVVNNSEHAEDNLIKLKKGMLFIETILKAQLSLKNKNYWNAKDILLNAIEGDRTSVIAYKVDDVRQLENIKQLLGA